MRILIPIALTVCALLTGCQQAGPVVSPHRDGDAFEIEEARRDVAECSAREQAKEPSAAAKAAAVVTLFAGSVAASMADDQPRLELDYTSPTGQERREEPKPDLPIGRDQREIQQAVEHCLAERGYHVVVWR